MAISGDMVFVISVWTMKDSWRAGVSKTDQTELVTDGIYQISRNPAFLGFDLVYVGILNRDTLSFILNQKVVVRSLKQMIERQKIKYGWEFLFFGANIDAVETASLFGIDEDRAVNYQCDSEGTALNYEVISEAISAVRCSVPLGSNWKKRIDEDFKKRGNRE